MVRILKNMGLEEDREESFLAETYSRCIEIGFRPEDIATHFSDLISFAADCKNLGIRIEEEKSGGNNNGENDSKKGDVDHSIRHPIPTILQIRNYIEKLKQEIIQSELIYSEQKKETELQEIKKSSIMQQTAAMLKENQLTAEKLDWCLQLKKELLAAGYSEKDYEVLLNAINFVKDKGCDLLAISAQFPHHGQLNASVRRLQAQSSVLEEKVRRLQEKAKLSEEAIESKSQMQWHMLELERMGFGFKELKQLHNIINEIHDANHLSHADDGSAVKIFLDSVKRHYDDILGFEIRITEIKEELQKLNVQHLAQLNVVSALPYVGNALAHLLNRGLNEDQIVELAKQSQMNPETIPMLCQHCSKADNKGQQQNDHFNPVWSLPSSASSSSLESTSSSESSSPSSPCSSYSPSLNSPAPQPRPKSESPLRGQPQQSSLRSIMPTGQISPSTTRIEPYSTAADSDTQSLPAKETSLLSNESILQPFTPLLIVDNPDVKILRQPSGLVPVGYTQIEGNLARVNNCYQPTLTSVLTARDVKIDISTSVLQFWAVVSESVKIFLEDQGMEQIP